MQPVLKSNLILILFGLTVHKMLAVPSSFYNSELCRLTQRDAEAGCRDETVINVALHSSRA